MTCASDDANLMRNLRRKLPGIPDTLLKQHLSDALIDFAEDSEVWRYVYERIQTYPDQTEYRVADEPGQKVVRIRELWVEDCGCEKRIPKGTEVRHCDDCCQTPKSFYEPEPGLILFDAPFCRCDDVVLRADVVLSPDINSDDFPPDLLKKHRRTIESAVLARAYGDMGQKWSNMDLSLFHENKVSEKVDDLKEAALRDMPPGRDEYCGNNQVRGNGDYVRC